MQGSLPGLKGYTVRLTSLSPPPPHPPFTSSSSLPPASPPPHFPSSPGDHFYKENEALTLEEQMITAMPDVQSRTLTDDDEFFVVACDGIWYVRTVPAKEA